MSSVVEDLRCSVLWHLEKVCDERQLAATATHGGICSLCFYQMHSFIHIDSAN